MFTTLGMGTIELCLILAECRNKEKVAPGMDLGVPEAIVVMDKKAGTQRELMYPTKNLDSPHSPQPILFSNIFENILMIYK